MANILEKIAATKRREVEALKRLIPAEDLQMRAMGMSRPVNSMRHSIFARDFSIIAEHKRRSPSKGEINPMSEVGEVAEAYACNGAAAMSVLTDTPYFGGSLDDLAIARSVAPLLPLLRKEFIVDEYQLLQARIYGADAVLLIASMLDGDAIRLLNDKAHMLGLETLVELHSAEELSKLPSDADMAGINNRDLTSFKTDISFVAMGYLNPIMQMGAENFFRRAVESGIDAVIIPDLPFAVYMEEYKSLSEKYGIDVIMLITPETSEERIRLIDNNCEGFIYMVSAASTTGARDSFGPAQIDYFRKIDALGLRHPRLIGFGISNKTTYDEACRYSSGAIIGSQFIKCLKSSPTPEKAVDELFDRIGR